MSLISHLKTMASFYSKDYQEYREVRKSMAFLAEYRKRPNLTASDKAAIIEYAIELDDKLTYLEKKLNITN